MARVLTTWKPEAADFWESTGKSIANRNLAISVPALMLAFAVWMMWSVIVVKLPMVGFKFTTDQLFWLAAMPGLSGSILRIFYSFLVPVFGGRKWTAISTASLLIPAIGFGIAVRDLNTPFSTFLTLSFLAGFGGGNFASSMANINYFFPKSKKGNALAINAGLGNLGVSIMQFIVPIVISTSIFKDWVGTAEAATGQGSAVVQLWLQNAGFLWVPFIIIATLIAWVGMNDIADAKASIASQMAIFKLRHTWIMCLLYIGTFGSFIGFSAGFSLLAKTLFPSVIVLSYAFLGPLVGALSRAASGWVADKWGGGRVTFWVFIMMILGVFGVLHFIMIKDQSYAFWGFLGMFLFLFAATGVGNASTFQMIPVIALKESNRLLSATGASQDEIRKNAERNAASIIGFTSAIGAFGAFFIPKTFGTSMELTGAPNAALYCFAGFYLLCLMTTWFFYTRKNAEISC